VSDWHEMKEGMSIPKMTTSVVVKSDGSTEVMPVRIVDSINHPQHYGGADNPYEAIKVIEAWNLGNKQRSKK
jgi:hypothetical protein